MLKCIFAVCAVRAHLAPTLPVHSLAHAGAEMGVSDGDSTGLAPLVDTRRVLQASAMSVCSDVMFAGRMTLASSGFQVCAVRSISGQVICWGYSSDRWTQTIVPSVASSNQVAVSVGGSHVCTVSYSGAISCWGSNFYNQTNVPIAVSSNQATVSASAGGHTCSLSAAGVVSCWGCSTDPCGFNQTVVPAAASFNQSGVSTGSFHTCSVSMSGAVVCWGLNDYGQTDVPDYASANQLAVSAGERNTCSLSFYGAIVCWGAYWDGMNNPIQPFHQVAVSVGTYASCSLSMSGCVTCWGWDYYQVPRDRVPPELRENQVAVAVGGGFAACALSAFGAVRCWGSGGLPSFSESGLSSGVALPCRAAALIINTPSGSLTATADETSSATKTTTPSYTVTSKATTSRSSSATPSVSATASQPLCRAPVNRVLVQSGVSGSFIVASSINAGNAGMYTSGSCALGYQTFVPGPRLVYRITLSDVLPLGGTLTLSTCGLTSNNTVLYLGTGCPTWFGSFNCLRANDDATASTCASNPLASVLSHTAASRIYFVQLGTSSGAEVVSGLSWSYSVASATRKSSGTRSRTASATRTRSATRSKSRSRKAKRLVA